MKQFKAMIILALLVVVGCSKGDDNGDGFDGQKSGAQNDGLSAEFQSAGMTYAILTGYVDLGAYNDTQRLYIDQMGFTAGIEVGEDMSSMVPVGKTSHTGSFSVTVKELKPNTTYYYRTYISVPEVQENYATIGKLSSNGPTGTFTTKDVSFSGTLSATPIGSPTFRTAKFSCTFQTGSIDSNETYHKVLAFCTNKSAIESNTLGQSYQAALSAGIYKQFYLEDGVAESGFDIGWWDSQEVKFVDYKNDVKIVLDEPGGTLYYCPLIVFGNVAFKGEVGTATMRTLPQTSGFVDLGLSCQWNTTNYGTSSPWDLGRSYSLDRNLQKGLASDERLPTKEEVAELNKCTIEEIDNGFLITGPNGNQIFMPFYGDRQILQSYGTSSTYGKKSSGTYDILYRPNTSGYTIKFETFNASSPFEQDDSFYILHHADAYVRTVKGGNGGGGGGGGTVDPDFSGIALNDLLTKPFGVVDIDLQNATYQELVDKLSETYSLRTDIDEKGNPHFGIYSFDNPQCFNNSYFGLPCELLDLYVSFSPDNKFIIRNISYSFWVSKEKVQDPYPYLNKIVKDFNDLGIPMSYNTNVLINVAEGKVTVDDTLYFITLSDAGGSWTFGIGLFKLAK